MSIGLLVLGILLFVGLVIIHEFGHFMAARRNGVEVEEFGIGFPPRAWSKKVKSEKGDYTFSLNWLPIGGFVKLKGESDAATAKGSLGVASTWSKTKIMLAGVTMNLVVAFGLLTVLAWVGMPKLLDNQFTVDSDTKIARQDVLAGYVEEGSPAAKAGLKTQDKIISLASEANKDDVVTVERASNLPDITKSFAGEKVVIHYQRSGEDRSATAELRSESEVEASLDTDSPKGYLGVSPTEYTLLRSTWSAPLVSLGLMSQFTAATFQGLGSAIGAVFQGDGSRAAEQVSGPVGIVVLLKDGSLLGVQFVLMIIAIISLTLAIMNVLPVPALDGGRLYMMLLSRLSLHLGGKKMSQQMEERIVGASFLFLIFLIVLITIVDVRRFF